MGNAASELADCPVCSKTTQARVLSCGHSFHFGCVEPWLWEKGTCPTCDQKPIAPMQSKIVRVESVCTVCNLNLEKGTPSVCGHSFHSSCFTGTETCPKCRTKVEFLDCYNGRSLRKLSLCLFCTRIVWNDVLTLVCGHTFHQGCSGTWLESENRCPECFGPFILVNSDADIIPNQNGKGSEPETSDAPSVAADDQNQNASSTSEPTTSITDTAPNPNTKVSTSNPSEPMTSNAHSIAITDLNQDSADELFTYNRDTVLEIIQNASNMETSPNQNQDVSPDSYGPTTSSGDTTLNGIQNASSNVDTVVNRKRHILSASSNCCRLPTSYMETVVKRKRNVFLPNRQRLVLPNLDAVVHRIQNASSNFDGLTTTDTDNRVAIDLSNVHFLNSYDPANSERPVAIVLPTQRNSISSCGRCRLPFLGLSHVSFPSCQHVFHERCLEYGRRECLICSLNPLSSNRNHGMRSRNRNHGMRTHNRNDGMRTHNRNHGMRTHNRNDGMRTHNRNHGMRSRNPNPAVLRQPLIELWNSVDIWCDVPTNSSCQAPSTSIVAKRGPVTRLQPAPTTNRANPAMPTNPVQSANPAPSRNPVQSENPAPHTNPVQSGGPAPPTNLLCSADPATSTNPVQSGDPAPPTNPVQSVNHTPSRNPVQSANPAPSTNHVQPENPAPPTNPVQSADPAPSTNPVQAENPAPPTNPVQSADPAPSTNLVQAENPVILDLSINRVQAHFLSDLMDCVLPLPFRNPVQSANPSSSTNPLQPNNPLSSTNPVQPGINTSSTNREQPANPAPPTDSAPYTNPAISAPAIHYVTTDPLDTEVVCTMCRDPLGTSAILLFGCGHSFHDRCFVPTGEENKCSICIQNNCSISIPNTCFPQPPRDRISYPRPPSLVRPWETPGNRSNFVHFTYDNHGHSQTPSLYSDGSNLHNTIGCTSMRSYLKAIQKDLVKLRLDKEQLETHGTVIFQGIESQGPDPSVSSISAFCRIYLNFDINESEIESVHVLKSIKEQPYGNKPPIRVKLVNAKRVGELLRKAEERFEGLPFTVSKYVHEKFLERRRKVLKVRCHIMTRTNGQDVRVEDDVLIVNNRKYVWVKGALSAVDKVEDDHYLRNLVGMDFTKPEEMLDFC